MHQICHFEVSKNPKKFPKWQCLRKKLQHSEMLERIINFLVHLIKKGLLKLLEDSMVCRESQKNMAEKFLNSPKNFKFSPKVNISKNILKIPKTDSYDLYQMQYA